MDGWELAQQAIKISPGLRVVYMTGFCRHGTARSGPVILKPWRPAELCETVVKALGWW
jgi:hypothetical protein